MGVESKATAIIACCENRVGGVARRGSPDVAHHFSEKVMRHDAQNDLTIALRGAKGLRDEWNSACLSREREVRSLESGGKRGRLIQDQGGIGIVCRKCRKTT